LIFIQEVLSIALINEVMISERSQITHIIHTRFIFVSSPVTQMEAAGFSDSFEVLA